MLDTRIAIYVIKRRPIEILQTFNDHAGTLSISSITFAELCHGFDRVQGLRVENWIENQVS